MSKKDIATVIVTDIVGYSKLTGKNQELALELLAEHDKIILNCINFYNGKVLVNRGDGFVAMFANHSDAVLCSVEVQVEIKKRNKFNTKDRKFNIRIGVHTGAYSKDKNDYHGECIDIASELEPLAPSAGILISEKLNLLIEYNSNIYTREYTDFNFNKKKQKTYRVYLNLIDWYLDNSMDIKDVDEKKFNSRAHELFHQCDYSGAVKFSNSILENTKDKNIEFENMGFLCNSFISLGQLTYSKKLFGILKKHNQSDLELKGHLLKLESHILFNNKKHSKADLLYRESYKYLKEANSKYCDEVLFYILVNLLLSDNLSLQNFNEFELSDSNSEYSLLINCIEIVVSKNKIEDKKVLSKIDNEKNKQFKSYCYWLLSKYYSQHNSIDKSYKYETLSQEMIKQSSLSISDYTLRNDYLNNLIIHQKILSETSIQIDDLIDVDDSDDNDFFERSIQEKGVFNYCVNCGKENTRNKASCDYCETTLSASDYK